MMTWKVIHENEKFSSVKTFYVFSIFQVSSYDLYSVYNYYVITMGLYRAQIAIVSDILDVAQENTFDNNGASITHLIRRANISHGRLSKILKNLVSQGLLEQVDAE